MSTGRVSIIIPCYQQGHWLGKAVDSALAQTHRAVEVIVVNDGSTDSTAAVAGSYGQRIHYVEQSNQGLSAARNAGIRQMRGDYALFMDSDDWLHPAAVCDLLGVLRRTPEATGAVGQADCVSAEGKYLSPWNRIESLDFDALTRAVIAPPFGFLLRREVFDRVGVFDPELKPGEDWDLWLRIARLGQPFAVTRRTVGSYRQHASSMSRDYEAMLKHLLIVAGRMQGRDDRVKGPDLRYADGCNSLRVEETRRTFVWVVLGSSTSSGRCVLPFVLDDELRARLMRETTPEQAARCFVSGLRYGALIFSEREGIRRMDELVNAVRPILPELECELQGVSDAIISALLGPTILAALEPKGWSIALAQRLWRALRGGAA